jgi:hypothetical protein
MSKPLTASARSSLIRLASELPKGSDERRAILAGLTPSQDKAASSRERDAHIVGNRIEALSSTLGFHFDFRKYQRVAQSLGENLVRLSETTEPGFDDGDRRELVEEVEADLTMLRRMKGMSYASSVMEGMEALESWVKNVEEILRKY